MPASSAENIFDAWTTYAKVVAGNYMFHKEISGAVNKALRARFQDRPFSLLDLGCGDAATLGSLLEGLKLSRYRGVDLSATALDLARENLKRFSCPVELANADLLDGLAQSGVFDAIHASFSLHHLSTERKAEFFQRAAERLAPGGLLLLVDVMREEDESLPIYLQHYCGWLRTSFTGLLPAELDEVCAHIRENDFPEPFSQIAAQARAAGLSVTGEGAKHNWHRFVAFARE